MSLIMAIVGGVKIEPGMRLVVEEPDYLYGLGTVGVVVREVRSVIERDGQPWVELLAYQVFVGGMRVPRTITIRLGAFAAAVKRAVGRRDSW